MYGYVTWQTKLLGVLGAYTPALRQTDVCDATRWTFSDQNGGLTGEVWDGKINSGTAGDCDDFLWTLTMRTKQVIIDAGVFFKLCSLVLSTAATIN